MTEYTFVRGIDHNRPTIRINLRLNDIPQEVDRTLHYLAMARDEEKDHVVYVFLMPVGSFDKAIEFLIKKMGWKER